MLLYLARHGEAAPAETSDSSRALTPKGIAETEAIARYLAGSGYRPDLIIHSNKARAAQTAGIYEKLLEPAGGVREDRDLTPLADIEIWADRLDSLGSDVMLVGHMPYMAKMAAHLVCGYSDENLFPFETSGVLCLERNYDAWSVVWLINPLIVGRGIQV